MESPRSSARRRRRGAGRSRVRPLILSAALAAAALTATEVASPSSDAAAAGLTAFHGGWGGFNSFFNGWGGWGGWGNWGGWGGWFHPRPATPPTTPQTPPTPPTSAGMPPTSAPAGGGTGGATPPVNPNLNCTLVVPRNPLSAAGLATPYRLKATDPAAGACHENNADQSAFVEAAIIDPASGAISLYHPLVIDDGTQPAIAPVHPDLPGGAVVGVWFGYQANVLTLNGGNGGHRGGRDRYFHRKGRMDMDFGGAGGCVNGTAGSPFGQFGYCNAAAFFATANRAIRAGQLSVAPLGTGNDGLACPTTRDFGIVDQDQSDNLPGKYLATADGRTAQFSAANQAALAGATALTNASDNGLVDNRWGPAVGCTSWKVPDLSQNGDPSPGLALNELQAAAFQAAPVALVPLNDPMTLDAAGNTSVTKTNLYRFGVDQPPINTATQTGAAYCTNMAAGAQKRITADTMQLQAAASPDPAAAANLYQFVVQRFTASWANLGCQALTGLPAPTIGAATASATATPTTTTSAAPTSAIVPSAPVSAPASVPAAPVMAPTNQPAAQGATTNPTITPTVGAPPTP